MQTPESRGQTFVAKQREYRYNGISLAQLILDYEMERMEMLLKIRNLTLLILMCGLCLTLLLTACGRSDAASSASAEAVSPQTVAESVYHGSEPIAIPETVYENGTAVEPETVENAVYD